MQQKFAKAIDEHRLRGEIVATKLANRIDQPARRAPPLRARRGGRRGDERHRRDVRRRRAAVLPARAVGGDRNRRDRRRRRASRCSTRWRWRRASQIADLLRVRRSGASPAEVIGAAGQARHRRSSTSRQGAAARRGQARRANRIAATPRGGRRAERAGRQKVVRLFELDGAVGLADLGVRLGHDEVRCSRAPSPRSARRSGSTGPSPLAARITTGDVVGAAARSRASRATSSSCASNSSAAAAGDPQALVEAWLAANAGRVAPVQGRWWSVPGTRRRRMRRCWRRSPARRGCCWTVKAQCRVDSTRRRFALSDAGTAS